MVKYTNSRKYLITNHLKQRFCERILDKPYDGRLSIEEHSNLVKILYSIPEEKTWVNNLNIVHYLKQKYGNKKILILKYGNFWFICNESDIKNHYIVVTVYDSTKNTWSKSCVNKSKKIVDIKLG
jgi:hypothetical protein